MQVDKTKAGVMLAIAAYGMWGFAPMYFKLLLTVPAMEILVHRIVWSVAILFILILGLKHFSKVKAAILNKKVMTILVITGLLLAFNWFLFIWAVNNDLLLEASLGYYINPLFNVFLGRIFLGEKLRPVQRGAVMLAIAGVAILIISFGQVPWVALALAGSFGIYGLLRKKTNVESMPGLLVESVMMLPFAFFYWSYFATPASDMMSNTSYDNFVLIMAGIVTTAPLLCFTAAAKRIQYSTLGFFQYIGPSIMFVLAVFLYGEALDEARLITFAFVWTGLVLFSVDSVMHYKQNRMALAKT